MSDAEQTFDKFDLHKMEHRDSKLSIYFETKEMMEESLVLLRFNCPEPECEFIASGWAELKWHVRDRHEKILCDLCIRNKKIFAHEHTLYSPDTLPNHLPSLRRGPGEEDEDTHPMCQFCRECLYSDDELYTHMREKHEECFLCKKQGKYHQYFLNWEKLEQHFRTDHFPCTNPSCLEQKFVVFSSQMDLQAHIVEAHSDSMTAKDRKGARRIEVPFGAQLAQDLRRGESSHPNRARAGGGGLPDPPPGVEWQVLGSPSAARLGVGSSRRANFGAQLTTIGAGDSPFEIPHPADAGFEAARKEAEFYEYIQQTTSSARSLTAVRGAIQSWKASESTVMDMLDTIFNVYERNMDRTAKAIPRLLESVDGERKKELSDAWEGMKAERTRVFPTLTSDGVSGSSSGALDYSKITSRRIINAKKATRTWAQHTKSTTSLYDRVERAASSNTASVPFGRSSATIQPRSVPGSAPTDNFPQLSKPSGSGKAEPFASVWSGAGSSAPPSRLAPKPVIRSVNVASDTEVDKGKKKASLPNSGFPKLPGTKSNGGKAPQEGISGNQSYRNITGKAQGPLPNAWSAAKENPKSKEKETTPPQSAPSTPAINTPNGSSDKKKKGKETLFTLGSMVGV
ncbi:hypothetical protein FRB99_007897 [Tulasnella sp. 403]|nr:hypothetical protein FRB99_007897 [Tulasnella sp. 403]